VTTDRASRALSPQLFFDVTVWTVLHSRSTLVLPQ
jgi:hypothetical protein